MTNAEPRSVFTGGDGTTPPRDAGMRVAAWVAFACGAVPLAAGVVVFALWLVSRHTDLLALGAMILITGLVAFVLAQLLLLWIYFASRRLDAAARATVRRLARRALLVLLSAPAAATAMTITAFAVETRTSITIRNDSSTTLTDIRVFAGWEEVAFEPISPGDSARRYVWLETEGGDPVLQGYRGDERLSTSFHEIYFTRGVGNRWLITVSNDAVTLDR